MLNPYKYLTKSLPHKSEGYKKLLVSTYWSVLGLIIFKAKKPLFMGLWYALRGKKELQYKSFIEGSVLWGEKVAYDLTNTIIYKSNQINIPNQGYMIFINHVNEFDFSYDCLVVSKPFLANQEIKKSYFAYWWMKAMGSQVFEKSKAVTIAVSIRKLLEGLKFNSFIVYPEGLNTHTEEIKPLKKGMIKIAFDHGIPVYIILKSGMTKFDVEQKGNVIGFRAGGEVNPKDFKTYEEMKDKIFSIMVKEKNILDKEVQQNEANQKTSNSKQG